MSLMGDGLESLQKNCQKVAEKKKIFLKEKCGNYIQGYRLAPGKKVNNLPPLTTSNPIFLAPAGGGCRNPSF